MAAYWCLGISIILGLSSIEIALEETLLVVEGPQHRHRWHEAAGICRSRYCCKAIFNVCSLIITAMPDKIRPLFFVYLPNEILAIIANELASDMEDNESLAALASCRLAAHALCSLATPLLFSSIRLTDLTSDYRNTPDCSLLLERATRLNQAITNRHIAASVHTLTLNCHQRSLQDPGNAGLISSILHGLPHIRNFALESVLGWMDLFFIPNDLVLAIQALCRSPSLTTLYLDHINNFSSTAITACPNLRCLRLRDIIRLQVNYIFSVPSATTHSIYIPVRQHRFEG